MLIYPETTLAKIAEDHYLWIRSVKWDGKRSPLEGLALIGSEIGEAANECRNEHPSDNFSIEISDIVLRILGFMIESGHSMRSGVLIQENNTAYARVDILGDYISDVVAWCYENHHDFVRYDRDAKDDMSPLALMAMIYVPLGKLIGAVENTVPPHDHIFRIKELLKTVLAVAGICGIDLTAALQGKIETNKKRGTKGRSK